MPRKKATDIVEEPMQEPAPVDTAPPQPPRRQGSDDLLVAKYVEDDSTVSKYYGTLPFY